MVSMQECLLQRKLDRELPERVVEQDLEAAHVMLLKDRTDIQAINDWHDSTIQQRMVEWQNQYLHPTYGSPRECPFNGEVLFCDAKMKEEQDRLRIVDTKESLVKAWYEEKHGLTVDFRSNQKGTMRYMSFAFYSADVEKTVRSRCLKGRHDFDSHVRVSLYTIRTEAQLPVNVLKIIKQFIPEYLEHLKQEKERVETKEPRW